LYSLTVSTVLLSDGLAKKLRSSP